MSYSRRAVLRGLASGLGSVAVPGAAAALSLGDGFRHPSARQDYRRRHPSRPQRLALQAYYYLWYKDASAAGSWQRNLDYRPALGFYRSSEPEAIRRHIEMALDGGIEGFAVNWHGIGDFVDNTLRNQFLDVLTEFPGFRFSIFFDTAIRFGFTADNELPDFRDDRNLAALEADLRYLARRYFCHPAYLTIEDPAIGAICPVLTVYISRGIRRGFPRVVATARRVVGEECGRPLYFVGDEVWWDRALTEPAHLDQHLRLVDAVTNYNLHMNTRVRQVSPITGIRPFTGSVAGVYNEYRRLIDAGGYAVKLAPGLLFRYDDSLGKGNEIIWPARDWRGIPGYYDDARRVFEALGEHFEVTGADGGALGFVTSFNEWRERTAVEPTWAQPDRHELSAPRDSYLRAIHDAVEAFGDPAWPVPVPGR